MISKLLPLHEQIRYQKKRVQAFRTKLDQAIWILEELEKKASNNLRNEYLRQTIEETTEC